MRFRGGRKPEWKGKPKSSPLDSDDEFSKLRRAILSGDLKPFEGLWMDVYDEQDGKRFKTKNPARLVRDHLRRLLRDANLESEYRLICRQTSTPGMWGVGVIHEPIEAEG